MTEQQLLLLAEECEKELSGVFAELDRISYANTCKVMRAFAEEGLSERHFNPTTGYGHNDDGRDLADRLFARVLGCEAGFVRHSIVSGTHAIGICLFGLLRPGDTLYAVSGKPYDTLESVIGFNNEPGSLADLGVKYRETPLVDGKYLDIPQILRTVREDESIKVLHIQRSKGYASRRTLTADEITTLYDAVKQVRDVYVFVDNCYGEFTNVSEPKADLLAGSLIKNIGGGMAESGGYCCGARECVELAATRLTVPGLGCEQGASLGQNKSIIKGLFYAPHTVANAKKTVHFAALLFKKLGFDVLPDPFEMREDIVQIISMRTPENLIAFCRGIQSGSPVDSFAAPVPGDMPGYADQVIMAAGAFVQGSSIELSADGPMRPPYDVYLQGGLTYESGKYGILTAAKQILGI
ncbi:MAG: methionine gamma-lyase family protein [Clostridia bacterium]|nr:methionine gamma-lyase family protein [Clostridia bacterium]